MHKNALCHVGILFLSCLAVPEISAAEKPSSNPYYSEPPCYTSRPNPEKQADFGQVGVTGLSLKIDPGVVLKVVETAPDSPASGKFKTGEIITGVNGVSLKGHNPFVILGEALTNAEAQDGKLLFDVSSDDGKDTRRVEVVIPVIGSYSKSWPMNCGKSKAIIDRLAAYYSKHIDEEAIEGALACLFLLSTGDDRHLPVVKEHLSKVVDDVRKSDNTWFNGYNGVLFCEYYLRTGDGSVLPVIQALCDNARDRQIYEIGWKHWGRGGANPRYMNGSLVNAASGPVVMSLLLAKECPVNVDDATLHNALKFWYRFAGHGSVPYGDNRAEGGVGSNGKDGMGAVIMQLACGARGDVGIYQKARGAFAASMIDSYACMTTGHADNGRSDAVWRGLVASYSLDANPAEYHGAMNRLAWWYDLSRRSSGGIGVASLKGRLENEGSGAGVALGYTAPLKTLRITGAARSKYAKDFTLPANLWGRKADLDFLSAQNGKGCRETTIPMHALMFKYGTTFIEPSADLGKTRTEEIVSSVCHRNYVVRTQAAKALKGRGLYDQLETLMRDPDPRVRRAALDAVFDYKYYFTFDNNPIAAEKITKGMLASFRKMLSDPDEALFVVDGALLALSVAPHKEIMESLPLIMPWTTSDEWWLRNSAFHALAAAAKDKANTAKLLPILGDILLRENRPFSRIKMLDRASKLAEEIKDDKILMKMASESFNRAVKDTQILPGDRAAEGGFSVMQAVLAGVDYDSSNALPLAQVMKGRLTQLQTRDLKDVINKLLSAVDDLPDADREKLSDLLYSDFRPEFIKRVKMEGLIPGKAVELSENEQAVSKGVPGIDILSGLTSLKKDDATWRDIGTPACHERTWKYTSFSSSEATASKKGKDLFPSPVGMEKWYLAEFDDSKWESGKAPIGKGQFRASNPISKMMTSKWGDGEFLLMRTSFEVDRLDYDFLRLTVFAKEGFKIYLNGKSLFASNQGYKVKKDTSVTSYHSFPLQKEDLRNLRKGKNVLAVCARSLYEGKKFKGDQIGYFDLKFQGLRESDLLGADEK